MSATGCCTTLPTSSYPHVLSYLCFEEIDIFLSKKLVFRHMLPLFPSFLPTWLSQATGDREWEKAYTSCICLSSSCQEVKRRGCRGSLLLLPSHAEERRVFWHPLQEERLRWSDYPHSSSWPQSWAQGTKELRWLLYISFSDLAIHSPFSASPHTTALFWSRASRWQVLVCYNSKRQPLLKQYTIKRALSFSIAFISHWIKWDSHHHTCAIAES